MASDTKKTKTVRKSHLPFVLISSGIAGVSLFAVQLYLATTPLLKLPDLYKTLGVKAPNQTVISILLGVLLFFTLGQIVYGIYLRGEQKDNNFLSRGEKYMATFFLIMPTVLSVIIGYFIFAPVVEALGSLESLNTQYPPELQQLLTPQP